MDVGNKFNILSVEFLFSRGAVIFLNRQYAVFAEILFQFVGFRLLYSTTQAIDETTRASRSLSARGIIQYFRKLLPHPHPPDQ